MTAEVFDVIYADPPWRYDNGTPGREIERHYPTMTHEEICGLDVPVAHVWGNQVDSSVADLPFERFDPHADPAQDSLFGGVA